MFLPFNLPGDGDLVEVEEEPGQVAHGEHGHYEHQHHGHPVLPPPPALPPPPDRDVDPGVEEADGQEGKETQHQEPSPVDVPCHVSLVHPDKEHQELLWNSYSELMNDAFHLFKKALDNRQSTIDIRAYNSL